MRWRIFSHTFWQFRRVCFFVLLLSLALFKQAAPSLAASPAGLAEQGQAVFQQKCVACHSIGGGRAAGPDLKGVTAGRERDWLVRFILEPDKMLAQDDPQAAQLLKEYNNIPMPNMGLAEEEAQAVLAYLESATGAPAPAGPQDKLPLAPGMAVPAPGDPTLGKNLFTGAIPLEMGGLPCLACHGLAGVSGLGGGTMGPDLRSTYTKYGEAGLGPVLATLPFPSMQPLYGQRPLTAAEQFHLKAFLQEAAAGPAGTTPAPALWSFFLPAAGSFLILLALAQAIWRGRLPTGRGSLAARVFGKGGEA